MFTSIPHGRGQTQLAKYCSVAAHGLLLLWLLHPVSPRLVAPSFVVHGDHGVQIAHLYWPAQQTAGSEVSPGTSAADSRQQLNSHLTWKRRTSKAKAAERELPRPRIGMDDQTSAPGQAVQARAAGSALGTVLEGPLTGEEVRPALPVVSPDPHVAADELGGLQGDVIVEVTIDEKGNIVQKVVIQSLAPAIDGKVLEALENWRFRPATRNGVAIASKQDVYYHFPRLDKG
ncbi:MAG TPA: energy transducer TonB [Terriglobales bacterium]|jgi:TonB family protein|nr:energy transducer TonB [Terriglobales bacterium]